MKTPLLLITFLLSSSMALAQGTPSKVWVADLGNGRYQNPIINADYSDPDVIRVGDDYYMTASSFNCVPGLPILHSKDLVNWTIANYALQRLIPEEVYDRPMHGKGVWAPSIRYHQGTYYIYWGDPDFGIFMVKTSNPLGEWDEPVLVVPGKGLIDSTPLFDDDGRVYLVNGWAGSRAHFNSVLTIRELSADGTRAIGKPVMVYNGLSEGNHTIEGPKLYKRGGYYYILAPAGGVAQGWQVALRSKNIYGPYESKTVMHQGQSRINGPHQGGWIETQTGESWFINFQDKDMYGRVLHLNPMTWRNDWPVIGVDKDGDGCGEPVETYAKPNVGRTWPVQTPQEDDDFNLPELGLQWQWHANYKDTFGFPTTMGYLRVYSYIQSEEYRNFWEVPNLLLQKFPAEQFTATTKVKISADTDGESSGFIVMGRDYCRLAFEKQGDKFVMKQISCKDAEPGNAEVVTVLDEIEPTRKYNAGAKDNQELDIYLRLHVGDGALCQFSYSLDGKRYKQAGTAFKAREGKWIGAKMGFFSTAPYASPQRGWIDIDWFKVTK